MDQKLECRELYNMLYYSHPNTDKKSDIYWFMHDFRKTIKCDEFYNFSNERKKSRLPKRSQLVNASMMTFL